MEAQKLKIKKKNAISKGKIKKTIKNVICRPDPIDWPVINKDEENILETVLKRYCVHIPQFKKPHWNDIKSLPKKERPQPPKIQKVEGLLFGISACSNALKVQNCSAVLIDANVNPQAIVEPIIETCTKSNLSVLCLKDLRQLSHTYFGIKTSCIGVQKDSLQDLSDEINKIFKTHQPEKILPIAINNSQNESLMGDVKNDDSQMDIDTYCPYVYRTNKKTRAFVPTETHQDAKVSQFKGQHFIKISQENQPVSNSKAYRRMILKKVNNNPYRVNAKHKT